MAQQLELFAGVHVPLTRCLAALEEDDLRAAQEALAAAAPDSGAEMDRRRLAAIEAGAGTVSPDRVHAAFAGALTAEDLRSGPAEVPVGLWFRLYARRMAAALEAGPVQRFRDWYALHFLLAAGRPHAALRSGQRIVATCRSGPAWLEAARAAWAAGEAELMKQWVLRACLDETDALDPAPPCINRSGIPGLDPPSEVLSRLAPTIETLWDEVEELDLPGPASAWVPSVGMIDGVFSPSLFGSSEGLEGYVVYPAPAVPDREPDPRAFFSALLAARAARAAAPLLGRAGCGPDELVARQHMKRLAPVLLKRYLARLGGARS